MKKTLSLYFAAVFVASMMLTCKAQADWMVRERIINLDWQNNDPSPSNKEAVNFSRVSTPELDVNYFFDKTISLEAMITALHPTVSSTTNGSNLGDVWVIPPTLTLQYHFFADQPLLQFYAGAGINYSLFSADGNVNGHTVHYYNNSIGPVLQAGTDLMITKSWSLNFDVKKIFLRPVVSVDGSPRTRDDLDPWVFGAGVGYRF